jgi:EAL domain-containing protein (putative c-di-GMP-specific phosphodiesterase class I)/FixJ family two-component response regulator
MSPPINSLLVVDGSAPQRALTVQLCRSLDVTMIHEAGEGLQALDLLATLPLFPDILIIDLEMGDMDAVELIQRLRDHRISVPLIVTSAREISLIHSVETMARSLGLSVLAGVQKPLEPRLFASALDRLVPLSHTAASHPSDQASAPAVYADALRTAIFEKKIKVHYQPKVDMHTGIVRGVEALARWQPSCATFVPPDQFIALAEREGLIDELTISIMHQAISQAASWKSNGLNLSLAINVSPLVLNRSSLVQEIMSMVKQYALPANQMVLELTESSLIDGLGAALGVVARLRLKGFGLSIDDYGTGFSSMQQLARIPFTELKIDRSFVHGAHRRSDLLVILRSALDLARKLDLVTVAEGIETIEDWRLLQECGCDIGQGYFIGRPMPASEVPAWVKGSSSREMELRPANPHAVSSSA